MPACEEKFLHSPKAPDMSGWPYDVPWIMKQMRDSRREVHDVGYLDRIQAALDDMTERCRDAERRAWNAAEKHFRSQQLVEG